MHGRCRSHELDVASSGRSYPSSAPGEADGEWAEAGACQPIQCGRRRGDSGGRREPAGCLYPSRPGETSGPWSRRDFRRRGFGALCRHRRATERACHGTRSASHGYSLGGVDDAFQTYLGTQGVLRRAGEVRSQVHDQLLLGGCAGDVGRADGAAQHDAERPKSSGNRQPGRRMSGVGSQQPTGHPIGVDPSVPAGARSRLNRPRTGCERLRGCVPPYCRQGVVGAKGSLRIATVPAARTATDTMAPMTHRSTRLAGLSLISMGLRRSSTDAQRWSSQLSKGAECHSGASRMAG